MVDATKKVYSNGKKSLDSLLREKAYSGVQDSLKEKDIDIDDVSDEDIENLVATKVEDMKNEITGLGKGIAFTIALFLLTGI